MLNLIVSRSGEALAARIAARSESGPESFVLRTTKVVVARAGPAVENPASNAMLRSVPKSASLMLSYLPFGIVNRKTPMNPPVVRPHGRRRGPATNRSDYPDLAPRYLSLGAGA